MRGLLDLALLPVLAPQALWVASRAMRLPEAAGPRHGTIGQGAPLRLMIVGDSSAAGVGVTSQEAALAGRLAARLSGTARVDWSVHAASGATVAKTLQRLADTPAVAADVAVVALGVNDAKNGVSMVRWRDGYTELIALLQARFGVGGVYVSGLPPLGEFPLLPKPLRGILGKRAQRFDATLQQLCRGLDWVTYVPLDLEMDARSMAEDGFHPGPAIYDAWAELIADRIRGA